MAIGIRTVKHSHARVLRSQIGPVTPCAAGWVR